MSSLVNLAQAFSPQERRDYICIDMQALEEEEGVIAREGVLHENPCATWIKADEVVKEYLDKCPAEPSIISSTNTAAEFLKRIRAILEDVTPRVDLLGATEALRSAETKMGTPSIVDKNGWKDLNLLTLVDAINRTETKGGLLYLTSMILRAEGNVQKIKNRSAIINSLCNDPMCDPFFEDVQERLKELGENESALNSMYNTKMSRGGRLDSHNVNYKTRFDKPINESCTNVVTFNSYMQTVNSAAGLAITAGFIGVLPIYFMNRVGIVNFEGSEEWHTIVHRLSAVAGALWGLISLTRNQQVEDGTAAWRGTVSALSVKNEAEYFLADIELQQIAHAKIFKVAKWFRALQKIYYALKEHPEITERLEHFQVLKEFMETDDSSLKVIFNALLSSTFNSKAKYLFRRGNVLVVWNLFETPEIKEHFRKAKLAADEFDMMSSLARLYNEGKKEGAPKYCFPEILEDRDTPYGLFEEYWNPVVLLSENPVVVNSIELNDKKLIVTGPNAAGKSTAARAIVGCILMMETGITPGTKVISTLYDSILTSTPTSAQDNPRKGLSFFQTQCITVKEFLAKVRKFPERKFFIFLDESYSGTDVEAGRRLAKSTMRKLSKLANCSVIFNTHYVDTVPLLEAEGANVVNFKVSVMEPSLKPTYLLTPGISTQQIGMEVARQIGLDADIIEDAEELSSDSESTIDLLCN